MATTYTQNLLAGVFGETYGVVNYTITPEPGTPLLPGDSISVSGTIRWDAFPIRSMGLYLLADFQGVHSYEAKAQYEGEFSPISIGKGSTGRFSLQITPDAAFYAKLTARKVNGFVQILVRDTVGWDPLTSHGNYTDCGEGTYPDLDVVKYRLAPQILAMDFERANAAGAWANDGQYLQCKALRIAKNAQAAVDDFTVAKITCAGDDGSSRSANLTQAQLTAALSSAGYAETKPGIFANFASSLGVTYTLTLTLGDAYEQAAAVDLAMRAFARIDFANAKNGGVAIGMFSTATDAKPKFEVADTHESFFYGGIYGLNNYQTGEVATGGHWIDGKPIYRKAFKGTFNGASTITLDANLNTNTVSALIRCGGWGRNSFSQMAMIPNAHYNNSQLNLAVTMIADGLLLLCGTNFPSGNPYEVWVEYTKK